MSNQIGNRGTVICLNLKKLSLKSLVLVVVTQMASPAAILMADTTPPAPEASLDINRGAFTPEKPYDPTEAASPEPLNPGNTPRTLEGFLSGNTLTTATPESKTLAAESTIVKSDPAVPQGWTRTASSPNYAYRIDTISGGLNREARLLNLMTGKEMVVGFGSQIRHNPTTVDTNGSAVLVAFRESGPIVGSLSWTELHLLSDLEADPVNGYKTPESKVDGNYQSHRFNNGLILVTSEIDNIDTPDPNDTIIYNYEFADYQMESPLYRLYHPRTGNHLYTTNAAEANIAKASGYVSEGITGYLSSFPTMFMEPLYRLYNPNAGFHFYTMNATERQHLINLGWRNEGIAGYMRPDNSYPGTPLYRLYNRTHGNHFFTASETERNALLQAGYISEGIAGSLAAQPLHIITLLVLYPNSSQNATTLKTSSLSTSTISPIPTTASETLFKGNDTLRAEKQIITPLKQKLKNRKLPRKNSLILSSGK